MQVNPAIIGILIAASMATTASFDPLLDVTYSSASWYAANKETSYSNSSTASRWTDFGIGGRTLGSAGAVQGPYYRTNAINSLPAFEFSASMYVTASTPFTDLFFRANEQTVFLVFMETALSANWWEKSLMACDAGGGNNMKWIWGVNNTGQVIWECHYKPINCDNQFNSSASAVAATTWTLADFTKTSGQVVNSYINGTVAILSQTATCYPSVINAPFAVGWGEGTTSNTFTGKIAELLFYNSLLSASDRQKIEGYLAWKYGLQAKLPPAHPFLLSPPTSSRVV